MEKTGDGWPHPIFSSEALTHRKSVFQAHATKFSLPRIIENNGAKTGYLVNDRLEDVFAHIEKLYPRTKRATHRMWAYRCVDPVQAKVLAPTSSSSKAEKKQSRKAKNALAPSTTAPNVKYVMASFSDVEPASGSILERLLELNHHSDVVVVVYRWYGGVKIGGERWRCISNVASEALRELGANVQSSQSSKPKA